MKLKEKLSGLKGKIFKNKIAKIMIPLVIIGGTFGMVHMKNKGSAQEEMVFEEPTGFSERGSIEMAIQGSGNIDSKYVKELKSKVSGNVENIYLKEGDSINKGQLIATVNTKADSSNDRSIYQKEKALRDLREDVGNLSVKSEYSGYVKGIEPDAGDDVAKKGVLASLVKKDKVKVEAELAKGQLANTKVGDATELLLTGSNFQKYPGVITKINEGNYNQNSGAITYAVEMEFDSQNGNLIAGMKGRVGVQKEGGVLYTTDIYDLKWCENEKIKFEVGGTLKEIYIKEDQYVKAGQVVARLENDDLQENLRTSQLEIDDEKDNSRVYAPINGTVVNVNVVSGESITSGQDVAKLADLNQLEMVIDVDEFDILKVKKGQRAIVEVVAANGESFEGEVKKISQIGELNGGTASYKVTIGIQNQGSIMLGMSANAKIILDSREDVIKVPINAIYKAEDKDMIAIKEENGDRTEVEVEVGLVSNDYAEVISGLEEGKEVYLSGNAAMGAMPDMGMEY